MLQSATVITIEINTMARTKKTRRITDIMPMRKTDKRPENLSHPSKKLTRYELDAKSREEKKKKKRKGLTAGSRHSAVDTSKTIVLNEKKDPRVGSRKKVPLIVEFVNKPEKGMFIPSGALEEKVKIIDPMLELTQLENNESLNQLLDELDAGKTLSKKDQIFVNQCLDRIAQLMAELGIEEESEDDLYRTFETIDINQFK